MNINERINFFQEKFDIIACGRYSEGPEIFISDGLARVCRFCKRTEEETTFNNKSHAIPECLGNHQLILKEECDACNKFFAEKLEDDLVKFTNPYRIIGQIKGKKGVPTYVSKNQKNSIISDKNTTVKSLSGEDFLKVDKEKREILAELHRGPYIPINVYKALIKIAISCIRDKKELPAFNKTIEWILDPDPKKSIINPAILIESFVPGPRPTDGVLVAVLRRKEGCQGFPYAIFMIAFGNAILQIIVPSHVDNGLTMPIKFHPIPAVFEFMNWPYGTIVHKHRDFSGIERRSEKFPITYQYDQMIEIDVEKQNIPPL